MPDTAVSEEPLHEPDHGPSAGALSAVCELAGPDARVGRVSELVGGQHSRTWRVDTRDPVNSVVVREFPAGDDAPVREATVLSALEGLGGLSPRLLAIDVEGSWSPHPTSLISCLDGVSDITPARPEHSAAQLGCALARVHATAIHRLAGLPRILECHAGPPDALTGPLAPAVRRRWGDILAAPECLVHTDYWSGNVVWRNGRLTGVVDWSGAGRGRAGYDLGWCRLDLVLLFDEAVAEVFLSAYEAAAGRPVPDVGLWDDWAAARSHDGVGDWAANYQPLGRRDLDGVELRRRHAAWTARRLDGGG